MGAVGGVGQGEVLLVKLKGHMTSAPYLAFHLPKMIGNSQSFTSIFFSECRISGAAYTKRVNKCESWVFQCVHVDVPRGLIHEVLGNPKIDDCAP